MSCDSYTQRSASFIFGPGGGRSGWAHFEFTRINIELTILTKEIEDLMNVRGIGEKNFLKLKPQLTVGASKADQTQQPQR